LWSFVVYIRCFSVYICGFDLCINIFFLGVRYIYFKRKCMLWKSINIIEKFVFMLYSRHYLLSFNPTSRKLPRQIYCHILLGYQQSYSQLSSNLPLQSSISLPHPYYLCCLYLHSLASGTASIPSRQLRICLDQTFIRFKHLIIYILKRFFYICLLSLK